MHNVYLGITTFQWTPALVGISRRIQLRVHVKTECKYPLCAPPLFLRKPSKKKDQLCLFPRVLSRINSSIFVIDVDHLNDY